MAFVPKTWIDRASEHPNRRTLLCYITLGTGYIVCLYI